MPIPVVIQWGNLPEGACFQDPESYKNLIFSLLSASVSGNFSGVVISPTLPDPSQQSNLWVKTDPYGNPIGNFLFSSGQWIWPHPIAPGTGYRMIWRGTEADLWSFDGGDGSDPIATPPTATTGAMWQIDTDFSFRFPLGMGNGNTATNPVAYDGGPATTVLQGATGGEERHVLITDEEAIHRHFIANTDKDTPDANAPNLSSSNFVAERAHDTGSNGASGDPDLKYSLQGTATDCTVGQTSAAGAGKSHQNMPPYLVVGFCRRTGRRYLVGG